MKTNYDTIAFKNKSDIQISKRNAYHQAGHAAAIYIGNKQKNLPAVHFQLVTQSQRQESIMYARFLSKYELKLEGGRLLEDLPCCLQTATRRLTPAEYRQCQCAVEADVTNLLAGYLAEAKHVALDDGEIFNANLVYLGALKYYGGSADLELIHEYMACLIPENNAERRQKLAELFLAAYSFINDPSNWLSIATVAEAICAEPQAIFTCEELIGLLDTPNPGYTKKPAYAANTNMYEQAIS